jgi:hypothetical protein
VYARVAQGRRRSVEARLWYRCVPENGDGGLLFVEAWQGTPTLPKRPVGRIDVEVVMDAEVVS